MQCILLQLNRPFALSVPGQWHTIKMDFWILWLMHTVYIYIIYLAEFCYNSCFIAVRWIKDTFYLKLYNAGQLSLFQRVFRFIGPHLFEGVFHLTQLSGWPDQAKYSFRSSCVYEFLFWQSGPITRLTPIKRNPLYILFPTKGLSALALEPR